MRHTQDTGLYKDVKHEVVLREGKENGVECGILLRGSAVVGKEGRRGEGRLQHILMYSHTVEYTYLSR